MKKLLLLSGLFITLSVNAQFLPTDSLDLCEDSTTHSYLKYGNVTVGTYSCGTNKSIRIGNSTGADSIVFNLAVTPNTDSVKLEIVMPWRGGLQNPKVWVENFKNDTVPYAGVGNCIPVFIKMGGLASRTADGSIKVKLMDTLSAFNMDGQFTYIKVHSKIIVGTSMFRQQKEKAALDIYPNPSTGLFYINGDAVPQSNIRVYNVLGKIVSFELLSDQRTMDLGAVPPGIYLVKIDGITKRIIKQ